jgi:hypothetical protein
MPGVSKFEKALEQVENLSTEDQEALVDLMRRRHVERRRDEIALNISVSREEFVTGGTRTGTVEDLLAESGD